MGDLNFEKIFVDLRKIQANAVSQTKYEELKTEVKRLKISLEAANNQLNVFKSLNQMLELRLHVVNEKLKAQTERQAAEIVLNQTPIEARLMRLANGSSSASSINQSTNISENDRRTKKRDRKREFSPKINEKRRRTNRKRCKKPV